MKIINFPDFYGDAGRLVTCWKIAGIMMEDCWHHDEILPAALIISLSMEKSLFVHGVFPTINLFVRNTTVLETKERYYVINYCCPT